LRTEQSAIRAPMTQRNRIFCRFAPKTASASRMWWDLSAWTRRAPTPPSAKPANVGDSVARRASRPRPGSSVASLQTANAFSLWLDLPALMRRAPAPPSAKAAHVGDSVARRASRPALNHRLLQEARADTKDVRIEDAGSRATQSRQSRQVRKEATVTG
jgi:hypothetical protein